MKEKLTLLRKQRGLKNRNLYFGFLKNSPNGSNKNKANMLKQAPIRGTNIITIPHKYLVFILIFAIKLSLKIKI